MMCLDLKAGDEVIMPSFTFVSTANAVVIHGGRPVFADIEQATLNLDPVDVARKITPRTRAIIPVHYAGVSANLDAIKSVIHGRDIKIVEDAAQGVDAYYKGRPLGTIGDIGCYSFHDTKNITCGEGGAFLTNDENLAIRAEIIREKGTNRSAFLRGEVDKYTWIDKGSSFIQSDILAGLLIAQWAKRAEIKKLRRQAWSMYFDQLSPFETQGYITLPVIPDDCESNYHIFHFNTVRTDLRDDLLLALKRAGIGASFHYVPLHSSPYGRKLGHSELVLPVTDKQSDSLVRLPLYPQLITEHPDFADRVSECLHNFFK